MEQWRQRNAKRLHDWRQAVATHERKAVEAEERWRSHVAAHEDDVVREEQHWQEAMVQYEQALSSLEDQHRQDMAAHEKEVAELQVLHQERVAEWKAEKRQYETAQAESNAAVDNFKLQYRAAEPRAVEQYCELALMQCQTGEPFAGSPRFEYQSDSGLLVVDYDLPRQHDLPRLKEVKYVQSRDEFVESELSERELAGLYDDLTYQVALRTVYELYTSDAAKTVKSIVFNGWVTSVDRATGKEVTACIMSFQSNREGFLQINLADVDPKACFRSLKGIAAAQLHSLTPIAPVLKISRDDPRFVSSYEVAATLSEGDNLAAMDWEDFEHLIRELFEQEFSVNGGEVKVTQASRDGGVDAVAFDPDPIRGGKIVIQAKRYTNVVGVSAVRDLYGTVINEGATKGILITTANYGADAHQFAQGKPLVLLSGNHLLHLLEKHGHKAKIDLMEAKQILADREKEQSQ